MSAIKLANVRTWLAEPMSSDVARAIERIARAADVRHVAVMPDVHLAAEVCVGTAIATSELIYPAAVGSDIGCGIAAMAFDATSEVIDEHVAPELLQRLRRAAPIHRHHERDLPRALLDAPLSDSKLERIRAREGSVQFGTLGRGNHFVELQCDDEARLWLMIHSGSRAMGPAIRVLHEGRATARSNGLTSIAAGTRGGEAYLKDMKWARAYARASRRATAEAAANVLEELTGARIIEASFFDSDHNHVAIEPHFGTELLVHRKGAMSARDGEAGSIPGSMGTQSFHVTGRGEPESLTSSSHGAGRAMSRDEARRRVRTFELRRKMEGIYFDRALAEALREESPQAYKDIGKVIRAEADLTRIVRRLRPILVYKGG